MLRRWEDLQEWIFFESQRRSEGPSIDRKKDIVEKDDLDTIDFDVESKYDEKIKVDIEKFKNILKKKFQNKNYDKILIKYGLHDNEKYDNDSNKKISKNMMNDIIKEIMLN